MICSQDSAERPNWLPHCITFQKSTSFRIDMMKDGPPSDISEFQTYLKNSHPHIGSISEIFEFENILMAEDPPPSPERLFRNIYIEKGHIRCFNFSFYGMFENLFNLRLKACKPHV